MWAVYRLDSEGQGPVDDFKGMPAMASLSAAIAGEVGEQGLTTASGGLQQVSGHKSLPAPPAGALSPLSPRHGPASWALSGKAAEPTPDAHADIPV